jgi:hypothetical protein
MVTGREPELVLPADVETKGEYHLFFMTEDEVRRALDFVQSQSNKYNSLFRDKPESSRLRARPTEHGYICSMHMEGGKLFSNRGYTGLRPKNEEELDDKQQGSPQCLGSSSQQ